MLVMDHGKCIKVDEVRLFLLVLYQYAAHVARLGERDNGIQAC